MPRKKSLARRWAPTKDNKRRADTGTLYLQDQNERTDGEDELTVLVPDVVANLLHAACRGYKGDKLTVDEAIGLALNGIDHFKAEFSGKE